MRVLVHVRVASVRDLRLFRSIRAFGLPGFGGQRWRDGVSPAFILLVHAVELCLWDVSCYVLTEEGRGSLSQILGGRIHVDFLSRLVFVVGEI